MRSFFTTLFFILTLACSGNTILVGPGKPVSSLKQGIAMATDGDTILLLGGTYREGSIIISKSITLIGQGEPVLDGEKKFEILLISGKQIRVQGIVFRNAGYSAMNDFAAIKLVDCSRVALVNNRVENAYFAIHISNSTYVVVRNNRIAGTPGSEQMTGNGIHLWKSSHALIEENHIQGYRDGIYFEFVTSSVISNNLSEKNIRYGLHFMFSNDDCYRNNVFSDNGAGVAVMYSKKVTMIGNHFERNWGPSAYGILLKDITDGFIRYNTFYRNTTGIHMEGSSRLDIVRNNFNGNGWAIKVQASCDDNTFAYNNFTGNSFDVGTNGTMVLNKFFQNYWDKYEGYDINKDGLGDIPFHPVSLYSMIVEQNPTTLMLLRSFTVSLLDKSEKVFPGITPVELADPMPLMHYLKL